MSWLVEVLKTVWGRERFERLNNFLKPFLETAANLCTVVRTKSEAKGVAWKVMDEIRASAT